MGDVQSSVRPTITISVLSPLNTTREHGSAGIADNAANASNAKGLSSFII